MSQSRISDLTVLSIESGSIGIIDSDDVIDNFAEQGNVSSEISVLMRCYLLLVLNPNLECVFFQNFNDFLFVLLDFGYFVW